MASDKYNLTGSWGATPSTGPLLSSGSVQLSSSFNENVTLSEQDSKRIDLDSDDPFVVPFDGVDLAHVINLFCDRPITALFTSAAGVQQSIPCDGWLMLGSKTVPFTGLQLLRSPAQQTTVRVFLGRKAS